MSPQSISGADLGIGILSSAIGGYGKYESGQQEKAAYDYNAQVTLQNTANQVQANQQKFSTLAGKQGSAYAAAGVDIASGSPLLTMIATAARGAQQGEQIEQAGTEEAALQQYYGKIAAFSGTMAGIGAFLSGVTSATSAYGKATNNPIPTSGSDGDTSLAGD